MLETLEQWGCETEKTMERFLDDKEFYQECYDLFIGGEGLEQLKCELDEGRITDAFVNAHGMKGTASNLGLVPIANILSKIVEPLRAGKTDGVMEHNMINCVKYGKSMRHCAKIIKYLSTCVE